METIQLAEFSIIGIAVKTSNQNGQAATDIPKLWERFFAEDISSKIPNKVDDTIYSVYTDYEGDYTQPYTTLLGCKVTGTRVVSDGFIAKTFPAANYIKYTTKGKLSNGIVYQAWAKIWASDIPRAYVADFEVYGASAQNPDDAEVDIFVGVAV